MIAQTNTDKRAIAYAVRIRAQEETARLKAEMANVDDVESIALDCYASFMKPYYKDFYECS